MVCRLYWLCSNTDYAVRAAAQSEAVLRLPAARGNFYDCSGLPLTGISQRWLALCFPGESSYARLYPYADADGQARLYRERNTSRPFLLDVVQDVSGLGVRCYAVPRRYAAAPLAEHSSATWTARATAQRALRLRWTMFFTPASGILCTVRSQRRDGCGGAVSRF
ncbi:MAG: hypothetical protein ACLUIR_09430 [Faecalibacterium prausnitzii]